MFPSQDNTKQYNTMNDDETTITGKSFLFDFTTGDFVLKDGKQVEINGYEALKIWIEKVLKTDKNKFTIYSGTNYGIRDLKELITSDYPMEFIQVEIESNVKEILLKNTSIKSVQNFKFERSKRLLVVRFDCSTIYGTVESGVII